MVSPHSTAIEVVSSLGKEPTVYDSSCENLCVFHTTGFSVNIKFYRRATTFTDCWIAYLVDDEKICTALNNDIVINL